MRKLLITTCGLTLFMMWVQVLESVHLAHCAEAYNFSIAIAACTVAALGLCATPGLKSFAEHPLCIGFVSVLAGLCGIASVVTSEATSAVFLCLHIALVMPVLIVFGSQLASIQPKFFFPLVCAAGVFSCAALPAISESLALVAAILFATAPVAGIACVPALRSFNKKESCDHDAHYEDSQQPKLDIKGGRGTAAVLCATLFAASLFAGLVTSPIYANSQTSGAIAAMLSSAMLLIMMAAGALLTRRGNVYRPALAATILQVAICLSMLAMVAGLFLFASGAIGTLTLSVGIVLGARQVLATVAWMLFPLLAAQSANSQRAYALLTLAAGTVCVPYIGAWASKMTAPLFSQLNTVAVGLIALVAACAIASVAFFTANRASKTGDGANLQPALASDDGATPTPANNESVTQTVIETAPHTQAHPIPMPRKLTSEELMREVQRRRQLQLEPYGLTERETQIVTLLLDGQTMKGIAEELFITERTVKFHSKNAYVKLSVANKKELMQAFSDLPSPHQETLQPSNS